MRSHTKLTGACTGCLLAAFGVYGISYGSQQGTSGEHDSTVRMSLSRVFVYVQEIAHTARGCTAHVTRSAFQ